MVGVVRKLHNKTINLKKNKKKKKKAQGGDGKQLALTQALAQDQPLRAVRRRTGAKRTSKKNILRHDTPHRTRTGDLRVMNPAL